MAEEREGIFRKQALERMSSPDRLDQLIQVVSPKDWLLLSTLLALGLAIIAWCIWGQLPTTVSGQAILVRPRKIVEIQSQAAGKLVDFKLRVHDAVKAGDVLGAVDQAEIRRQLEADRGRLAALEAQDREKSRLQQRQTELQERDFAAQKRDLELQIANREQSIRNGEKLAEVLQKRLDALREAIQAGIEPRLSSDLMQTEKAYLENQARTAQLHTERGELESQIKQLDTRRTDFSRTLLEASSTRTNQILELRRSIALNEVQLDKGSRIVSEYSGRVVEVAASFGQVLSAGSRLAYLEIPAPADDLVCLLYLPVGDGKRIRPGMKVQATPDTVKRERFGGIVGKVSSVSGFPVTKEGTALMLGNAELAGRILKDEPHIEIVAELEQDKSTYTGYRWSSSKGPRIPITAGTTASGRVTVEMRSPITYLLPFLRGVSGVD